MSNNPPEIPQPPGLLPWVTTHLPALLYGWFWVGMVLCGLLAPDHRVAALDSALVTEGWHLSVMACLLGSPPLVAYWLRMSGRWTDPQSALPSGD